MANEKWFNNIARLIKYNKEDGSTNYFLKFERAKKKQKDGSYEYVGESPFPLVINEGDTLQARLKKDELAKLVKAGKLSQEIADQINETVKFEFNKGPDKKQTRATTSKKAKLVDEDDEVNF